MEDVMPAPFRVWLGRPRRPRPVDAYVRKHAKIIKCKYGLRPSVSPSRTRVGAHILQQKHQKGFRRWIAKEQLEDALVQQLLGASAEGTSTEAKFRKLANNWSSDVGNVSSVGVLTSHPTYQEIVRLGWDVVPFLLADLQQNRGFWFTALNEITGIRPFDPSDAGNSVRMTEAWIRWGKRKGII